MIIPIRVDFGKLGDLNLRYNDSVGYTQQDLDRLTHAGNTTALIDLLAQTIVEWDLLDGDGNVLPITHETVGNLGVEVLHMIEAAIYRKNATRKRSRR